MYILKFSVFRVLLNVRNCAADFGIKTPKPDSPASIPWLALPMGAGQQWDSCHTVLQVVKKSQLK